MHPSFPYTDFNLYYTHSDTPTLGGGEITRGFIPSHLCLKQGSQSLDYLYSCTDLYIAMSQQKTLPKDKYQCRKSNVQWDYNPANLILTMRRKFYFSIKYLGKKPPNQQFLQLECSLKRALLLLFHYFNSLHLVTELWII